MRFVGVKTLWLLLFLLLSMALVAQSLTVSGTISSGRVLLSDALIDVYEYNSTIQTLHSDSRGSFSFPIVKGKEYIILIYKPGYVLQSFSFSDSKLNATANYDLLVSLDVDPNSPDGLYFTEPTRRIATDVISKNLTETKFFLDRIKPQQRSDSVSVLLNRAQANQYILIAKIKMSTGTGIADSMYSKQILTTVKNEISSYASRIAESNKKADELLREEDAHVAATFHTKDDAQLNEITLAQKTLAERLQERVNNYLLQQQLYLAEARKYDIEALQYQRLQSIAADSAQRAQLKESYWHAKSDAANARYMSMDANRKFQLHSRYQVLQYQEYVELLRYKDSRKDAQHLPAASAPKAKPLATNTRIDTSDNLSGMSEVKRTTLIQQALQEEERFSNYEESTEQRNENGIDVKVKVIHISDENYEQQIDKGGSSKYLKNGKPVTKLTFDFETKRKFVDVLKTIKDVERLK